MSAHILIKDWASGHHSAELFATGTKVEGEKCHSRSKTGHADSLLEKSHLWIKGWAPGYKSVGMSGGAHAVDEGLVPHPLMDHHACVTKYSPFYFTYLCFL
jgi:hypothetical protein